MMSLEEMMSLEGYYEICQKEEAERHANPCCVNCIYYYEEYGYPCCTKHDEPMEDINDKCQDWR